MVQTDLPCARRVEGIQRASLGKIGEGRLTLKVTGIGSSDCSCTWKGGKTRKRDGFGANCTTWGESGQHGGCVVRTGTSQAKLPKLDFMFIQ